MSRFMKYLRKFIRTPAGVILSMMAIVFLSELSIMWMIGVYQHRFKNVVPDIWNLLDPLLLTLLVSPALYIFVFLPLQKQKLDLEKQIDVWRNNTQLRALIEGIPDLVWLKDPNGEYLACNHEFEQFFGAQEAEIVGKTDYDFVDTELADFFRQKDKTAMGENRIFINEEWITYASDSHRALLETRKVAVHDTKGEIIGVLGIGRDITERRRIEEQLRIAATAFESQEGIMITEANGFILQVNQAFTQITGYEKDDVIGKTPKLLSSGRQDKQFYRAMWESINTTGKWKGEIWNKRKNGEIYSAHLTITAVKDADGIVTNYVSTLIDNTKEQEAIAKIDKLAFYDPLTKLPNRQLLLDRLNQALASRKQSGNEGALMFIDLDDFKTLNDTLGHDVGDLLLMECAARISNCMREGDTVARLGGDEFVVLLKNSSTHTLDATTQTKMIAENIIAALNEPYKLNAYECQNSASIGAVLFDNENNSQEILFKHADIALYQAKKAGRNRLSFFDPRMQDAVNIRADLVNELRKALDKQQFQLHYQIQVDSNGHAIGAEALIRWMHPERGMISPYHFIPLAEDTRLILPIGQWVLETACAQLAIWQNNVLTRDLTLAVNVSSRQFRQVDFVAKVQKVLNDSAIDPTKLKLELTESLLVDNVQEIVATMNALKALGISFSLDDFGTGYSSLQYLKQLPLDQLKIDQSFVRDLVEDSSDKAIVLTVITMAHSLGLNVIAEGVETEEQRQFLLQNGCANYQGYLFSKPVPVEVFEALLREI